MAPPQKWTERQEKLLIKCYRDQPTLWDSKHEYYYRQDYRSASLAKMKEVLLENALNVTVAEMKMKVKNLRSTFIRENKKVETSRVHGTDGFDYKSRWRHYRDMLFLLDGGANLKEVNLENTDSEEENQSLENHFKVPSDYNEDGPYKIECAVDVELMLEGEASSLKQLAPTSLTDATTSSESESQSSYTADSAGTALPCTSRCTAADASSVHKHNVSTRSTADDVQLAMFQSSPKIVPEMEPRLLLPQVPEEDDSSYFAKSVAIALRKFDDVTREEAKLGIQHVLLDCMRKLKQKSEICRYVKTENH